MTQIFNWKLLGVMTMTLKIKLKNTSTLTLKAVSTSIQKTLKLRWTVMLSTFKGDDYGINA